MISSQKSTYEPNEMLDILDENGNITGRCVERGGKMSPGDYYLIVHVWKHNSKGEWLIDKRAARGKDIDGKWETTGGAVISGEDSLAAALRETREELGINLDPGNGFLFRRVENHGSDGRTWFTDAWVFEWDGSIDEICFQESETCDAAWASADEIRSMMATGEFIRKEAFPYFDEMAESRRVKKSAATKSP